MTETIDHQAHNDAWAEALRSGDYGQTAGQMTNNKGAFCCLGVACKLAGVAFTYDRREGYGVAVDLIDGDERDAAGIDGGSKVTLGHMPSWLRRTLALTLNEENILAALNDSGVNFANIARLVELPYRERRRIMQTVNTARNWLHTEHLQ